MAKRVLDDILDEFCEKLTEQKVVDSTTVRELRELFATGNKLKADDFVEILSRPREEDAHDSD